MRKKDFRYLHGALTTIANHVDENIDGATVTYENYDDAALDTHMNFQSLKQEEQEAVDALRADILSALDDVESEEAEQKAETVEQPTQF